MWSLGPVALGEPDLLESITGRPGWINAVRGRHRGRHAGFGPCAAAAVVVAVAFASLALGR